VQLVDVEPVARLRDRQFGNSEMFAVVATVFCIGRRCGPERGVLGPREGGGGQRNQIDPGDIVQKEAVNVSAEERLGPVVDE